MIALPSADSEAKHRCNPPDFFWLDTWFSQQHEHEVAATHYCTICRSGSFLPSRRNTCVTLGRLTPR
jgi:hypothetical protein